MKKMVLIYGSIAGLILGTNMLIMVGMCYSSDSLQGSELMGYAMMLVVFSILFIGVRQYREKVLGGYMTFGQGLKAALLMTALASTFYVVFWLIDYYFFVPDFMEVYSAQYLKEVEPNQVAEVTKQMDQMKDLYKNPLFVILITYSEVLPVGIVVSLISALVLKKKEK